MEAHRYMVVNGVSIPLLRFKNGIPQDDYTREYAIRHMLSTS